MKPDIKEQARADYQRFVRSINSATDADIEAAERRRRSPLADRWAWLDEQDRKRALLRTKGEDNG